MTTVLPVVHSHSHRQGHLPSILTAISMFTQNQDLPFPRLLKQTHKLTSGNNLTSNLGWKNHRKSARWFWKYTNQFKAVSKFVGKFKHQYFSFPTLLEKPLRKILLKHRRRPLPREHKA